jgi:hypothetical protein
MRNKAFRITGKRGSVLLIQFCNGPLQNWILNTHLSRKTLRVQGMKRIWVPV